MPPACPSPARYFYQACKHNQGRYGRRHFFAYAPPAMGASAAVNSVMVVDILLFPSRTILLYGELAAVPCMHGDPALYEAHNSSMSGGVGELLLQERV